MSPAVAAILCSPEGDRGNVSVAAAFAAFLDVVCGVDVLIRLRSPS